MVKSFSHADIRISGVIKWFDTTKGFGFITADDVGRDIMIHKKVLNAYGVSSFLPGTEVEIGIEHTERGVQATCLYKTSPPQTGEDASNEAPVAIEIISDKPLPSRIKCFDNNLGFGFANAVGVEGDIFVHESALHKGGFSALESGEAVFLMLARSVKGLIASEVQPWDMAA